MDGPVGGGPGGGVPEGGGGLALGPVDQTQAGDPGKLAGVVDVSETEGVRADQIALLLQSGTKLTNAAPLPRRMERFRGGW